MNQTEEPGAQINISNLPSHARVCINVLLISKTTPTQTGYAKTKAHVLGSCQVSLFDESYLLRQGPRNLSLWPFMAFDPRMVCQGECFKKVSENFNNTALDDRL